MGRPRIPTEVLKLRGSRIRQDRRGEPKPNQRIPDPPFELPPEAQQNWDRVSQILDAMNIVTVADGDLLARYCLGLARYQELALDVAELGDVETVLDGNGVAKTRVRPAVYVLKQLEGLLRDAEREMGLTPAARSRISTVPASDCSDPAAQYLSPGLKFVDRST